MTAAAGSSAFHVPHQISSAFWSGNKVLTVTVTALKACVKVKLVAEKSIGIKAYLLDSMTLGAAAANTESSFAIMTTAARQTLFHLFHVNVRVGSVRLEELWMTILAAEK